MGIELRTLRVDELDLATEVCLRSKAYWGYDDAFMAACRDELTLTERDLLEDLTIGVFDAAGMAGVAQVSKDGAGTYLEKLFIDTDRMGLGLGRTLFEWSIDAACKLGATEMIVEADPGAAPFYERMGCVRAGAAPSGSVAGRALPRFVYPL